jgi:predicted RecB family endonuclease
MIILLIRFWKKFFYEFIEEGYDIDEIVDILTENIDINVDILNEAKVTYGHDTENETKTDRLGKVKSGIKRVGKALAKGAGYVSGAAIRGAKSAAKEFGSAYEKGHKRSSDTESSDSESRTRTRTRRTRTSRSTPGLLSRIGTKLKSGLKKVVGKTARSVSRGARNIARSVGEEVEISEKITADTDMGTAIKDFYGSDSPQLAGRTKEERREAAIAAVLTARRGGKKIGEAIVDQPTPADDKVREKQNAAIKKQQMQNMKTIQRKREQLERQKLKLQQQDKLPMHSDSYEPEGKLVDEGKKKNGSYLETDMQKRGEANVKAIEDMKKTKDYADMVKSARKSMGVDEAIAGLRPASERTKNTITSSTKKKARARA